MPEERPLIQIVDRDDNPLCGGTMDEAQINGLWHRIARVMVWDELNGLYLLHKVPPILITTVGFGIRQRADMSM